MQGDYEDVVDTAGQLVNSSARFLCSHLAVPTSRLANPAIHLVDEIL